MKIKIPNILTIGRIIIVPIFVLSFFIPGVVGDLVPFFLFILASFTDFLDGPNYEPKPWGWSSLELAKWNAWSSLGEMDAKEAMTLYVHTMEEENENWWQLSTNDGDPEDTQVTIENARRWTLELILKQVMLL